MQNKSMLLCNVFAAILTWSGIVVLMDFFYQSNEFKKSDFPPPAVAVCSFMFITCFMCMVFFVNLFKWIGLNYTEWNNKRLMEEYYEQFNGKM